MGPPSAPWNSIARREGRRPRALAQKMDKELRLSLWGKARQKAKLALHLTLTPSSWTPAADTKRSESGPGLDETKGRVLPQRTPPNSRPRTPQAAHRPPVSKTGHFAASSMDLLPSNGKSGPSAPLDGREQHGMEPEATRHRSFSRAVHRTPSWGSAEAEKSSARQPPSERFPLSSSSAQDGGLPGDRQSQPRHCLQDAPLPRWGLAGSAPQPRAELLESLR